MLVGRVSRLVLLSKQIANPFGRLLFKLCFIVNTIFVFKIIKVKAIPIIFFYSVFYVVFNTSLSTASVLIIFYNEYLNDVPLLLSNTNFLSASIL